MATGKISKDSHPEDCKHTTADPGAETGVRKEISSRTPGDTVVDKFIEDLIGRLYERSIILVTWSKEPYHCSICATVRPDASFDRFLEVEIDYSILRDSGKFQDIRSESAAESIAEYVRSVLYEELDKEFKKSVRVKMRQRELVNFSRNKKRVIR